MFTDSISHPYFPARSVELYDAGMVISAVIEGGFCECQLPGFRLNGDTVENFMKHLGLTPQSVLEMVGGEPLEISLGDREFTIVRETRWYDEAVGASIRAIEARVLGSRQLDFRITLERSDGSTYCRTHTYVGSFAVEWGEP